LSKARKRRKAHRGDVQFAHESERHVAGLLDFYGVRWEYEPVQFVLTWDELGRPTCGFRPDFYLPDHGCFIEVTTLNQRLVTRKNAKVRRMKELYPEVEVKLLYQRDLLALASKYHLSPSSSPAA
jgi:hypoxanthine phosphoribosyltransferase